MKIKKLLPIFLLSPLAGLAQNAPAPYGVLPTERQLRWQEMEMYALVHFTPTTFQDQEWGYGDAEPSLFNPTRFDANQVAKAAASGSIVSIIDGNKSKALLNSVDGKKNGTVIKTR